MILFSSRLFGFFKIYNERVIILQHTHTKETMKPAAQGEFYHFIMAEQMTSEADAADVRSPQRGQGSTQTDWAGLLQTNNYPSWSQSQEVTSTTSPNNSFQGLIAFPCRKFFLSSQLSPSCCPVSPNGWVSFPSPPVWRQRPRVRNRTGTRLLGAACHFCPMQRQCS